METSDGRGGSDACWMLPVHLGVWSPQAACSSPCGHGWAGVEEHCQWARASTALLALIEWRTSGTCSLLPVTYAIYLRLV